VKNVIRRLRTGKVLAILPDVRMAVKGVGVPFLGGVANVGQGTALFARHAGVPIFPCVVTRLGWCRHRIDVFDPVYANNNLDKTTDILRMTTAVMAIIEKAILLDPAQWFWFNKRWILDPLHVKRSSEHTCARPMEPGGLRARKQVGGTEPRSPREAGPTDARLNGEQ